MSVLIGLLPSGDIGVPAAATLTAEAAAAALDQSVAACVLGRSDRDRCEPHDLLREFAREIEALLAAPAC